MPRAADPPTDRLIRLSIVQPSLAKYRVPVFRELAGRPEIDLHVFYADNTGIPNESPDGFAATLAPMVIRRPGGHPIYWHPAQLARADPAVADVLNLSWDLHYASLIPALLRARRRGVPTVLWGHGYSKRERGWRRWLRWRVARLATAVLLYNRATAKRLIDDGLPAERVFVALNTLDQSEIQAARADWLSRPGDLAAFRERHGLVEGRTVLFVSRLDGNRVDLLIDAAALLAGSMPDLKVILIGKGEERPALERRAADLGLSENVRFLGAVYGEAELAPWFLSADCYCYPVNIGLSLMHAFGYGLPVVTSDRTESQNPEIEAFRDGENGLTYPDGDPAPPEALAAALGRLLADPALRVRLGAEARRTVLEEFTLLNMVDGFVASARFAVGRRGSQS